MVCHNKDNNFALADGIVESCKQLVTHMCCPKIKWYNVTQLSGINVIIFVHLPLCSTGNDDLKNNNFIENFVILPVS